MEQVKCAIEALKQIEQMSDCGSYEASIIRMKSIATDALEEANKPMSFTLSSDYALGWRNAVEFVLAQLLPIEDKNPFKCPSCGRDWDTSKYNACECGAQVKSLPIEEGKDTIEKRFAEQLAGSIHIEQSLLETNRKLGENIEKDAIAFAEWKDEHFTPMVEEMSLFKPYKSSRYYSEPKLFILNIKELYQLWKNNQYGK